MYWRRENYSVNGSSDNSFYWLLSSPSFIKACVSVRHERDIAEPKQTVTQPRFDVWHYVHLLFSITRIHDPFRAIILSLAEGFCGAFKTYQWLNYSDDLILPRLRLESPGHSWAELALIIAGIPRHHRTAPRESLLWAVLTYSKLYMSSYWTQTDVSTWSKGHGHGVPIFGPCQGHFWTMLGPCLL